MAFSGFCIGGTDWFRPELVGVDDPAEQRGIRRSVVAEEARLTHRLGGNLMRFFYAVPSITGDRELVEVALGAPGGAPPTGETVPDSGIGLHRADVGERVERLDRADTILDQLLKSIAEQRAGAEVLDFSTIDDVVAGVEDANAELGDPHAVRVLLTLVAAPPRWIVEAPCAATLNAHGRAYSFTSLWERYLEVHEAIHRLLASRYAHRPVAAFEIGNEPDYVWIPEDMKIEFSTDPLLYPLAKYVTELQLSQVPEREEIAPAVQPTPWGFEPQDAEWASAGHAPPTPVTRFEWGPKFDWYVRCFAEFQERLAEAIRDEARALGVTFEIVSGSVTHNNIDYLLRIHRANPRAFDAVTKIGLHPYHWVRNDVWDTRFVDDEPTSGWIQATPREFAGSYFKRFDFLEEIARCVRGTRGVPRELRSFARAVRGKKLWITEFGIGTKVLGTFNSPIAEHTRFIRPRQGVGLAAGHEAAVWEDLWEAFLEQADDAYLDRHEVDALLLYSLREIGVAGLDMNDDDRSNLAVLHRDGSSRMDPATLDRIHGLLAAVAGAPPAREPATPTPGAALHRRPWRSTELSRGALDATTMLSVEERQLLAWLASSYWQGGGAIVDGGCFLGGSTLALAEGLRSNPNARAGTRIDVFDLFEVEPYMVDMYFSDTSLTAGDSFRSEFDRATGDVADLLDVHEGDLATIGWDGRPIEILFVDIAKSWALNDVVIRQFMPCLAPGRSVLVHQDYAFAFQPWIAITMEHLGDYFEPVAFAEYNTVVFICHSAVPPDVSLPSDLADSEKDALFDRAMKRFRGYPRSYLEAGKAILMAERGNLDGARRQLLAVRERFADDELALRSVELVEAAVGVGAEASNTPKP